MQVLNTSVESVIAIWDDYTTQHRKTYRAFWVSKNEMDSLGEATCGSPVIGYCSPGGTYKTIKACVAECRRLGYDDPIYRNGRLISK